MILHNTQPYMNKNSIFLSQQVEILEKEALSVEDIGLLYGKMGIAIFFFQYARYSKIESYEDFAMQLIESVVHEINETTPVDYAFGLAGIGTGIEYLIQEKFIHANSNEILKEIDYKMINVVHSRLVKNASLEKGICGIGRYYVYRIKGQPAADDHWQTVINKEHLIYLIDWLEELMPVSNQYMKDIQQLLVEILPLGIYITKVEQLIKYCTIKLQGNNLGIKNGIAGIGLSLINSTTPW